MNGMRWSDYKPEKQTEILQGLLEECCTTYGGEVQVKENKVKELSRYFYRTQEESASSVVTSDKKQFQACADLDQSQMSKAVKDQPLEVKVEYPKKVAFVAAVKVASSGIKRLERLFTDGHRLKAQLQASMPAKVADFTKPFGVFAEFLDNFRNAVASAEKLTKTDLDESKSVEQEKKISDWSCKATEHLDEITLLHKRARGWLAWGNLADLLLWLPYQQIASCVAKVWKRVWVQWGWLKENMVC